MRVVLVADLSVGGWFPFTKMLPQKISNRQCCGARKYRTVSENKRTTVCTSPKIIKLGLELKWVLSHANRHVSRSITTIPVATSPHFIVPPVPATRFELSLKDHQIQPSLEKSSNILFHFGSVSNTMRFSFKSEGNSNDTKTKMDEIEKLARVIEDGKAKNIIVLCGAGVSTGKFLTQKIRVFGNIRAGTSYFCLAVLMLLRSGNSWFSKSGYWSLW